MRSVWEASQQIFPRPPPHLRQQRASGGVQRRSQSSKVGREMLKGFFLTNPTCMLAHWSKHCYCVFGPCLITHVAVLRVCKSCSCPLDPLVCCCGGHGKHCCRLVALHGTQGELPGTISTHPLFCAAPWDSDIDEYDNQDDVGYVRKDVVEQMQFEELELDQAGDGTSRDGTDQPHFFTHGGSSSAMLSNAEDDEDEDDEDEDDDDNDEDGGDADGPRGSSSGSSCGEGPGDDGSLDLAPVSSQLQQQKLKLLLAKPPGNTDESWDQGPVGIRFAEPVTTPTKASTERPTSEELKPVLSRVESLSSSFKDFDIERTDDEQFSGRVSGMSDGGDGPPAEVIDFQPPAEVIDFQPIPLSRVTPTELETLRLQPADQPDLNPLPGGGLSSGAEGMAGFSLLVPVIARPASSTGKATNNSSSSSKAGHNKAK